MELLAPPRARPPRRWQYIINTSKKEYRNIVARMNPDNDPEISALSDLLVRLVKTFSKLEFNMTTDDTELTGIYKDIAKLITGNQKLSDIYWAVQNSHHYSWRTYTKSTLRWPNNYMDVCPIPKQNCAELLRAICIRADMYERHGLGWPTVFPRCTAPRSFFEQLKPDVDDLSKESYEKSTQMVMQLLSYNYPTWMDRVRRVMRKSNDLIFTFDGRQICDNPNVEPALHFNNVLYIIGWDLRTRLGRDKPADVLAIEYKIFVWCAYDILHNLIKEGYGGEIIINDPILTRTSYFFVRLGADLCGKTINFRFLAPSPLAAQGYRIHTLDDLTAAQAIYFGYNHEFYGANMSPSPSMCKNNVYVENMPLVDLYLAAKKKVEDYATSISAPYTQEEYDAELNFWLEKAAQFPVVDNPEIIFVCAPPGTGKSTYIKTQQNHFVISLDDIKYHMKISGRTIYDVNDLVKTYSAAEFSSVPYHRMRLILANSVFHDARRAISKHYDDAGIKMRQFLMANLKINVIMEDIGKFVSISDIAKMHENMCDINYGKSTAPDNTLQFPNARVVCIYANISIQYNQQAYRALTEERYIRYENLKKYNRLLWAGVHKKWRSATEIYAADNERLIPIYKNGLKWKELEEYKKKFYVEKEFEDFLKTFP